MDRLGKVKPPEGVQEANQYDTFKTSVEVCKANGINFALMCDANVDMATEQLHKDRKIRKTCRFKDGVYYELDNDERKCANKMAEEICLSTRFLSLSNNKLNYASKQELKNDKIRGKDNYHRTISIFSAITSRTKSRYTFAAIKGEIC